MTDYEEIVRLRTLVSQQAGELAEARRLLERARTKVVVLRHHYLGEFHYDHECGEVGGQFLPPVDALLADLDVFSARPSCPVVVDETCPPDVLRFQYGDRVVGEIVGIARPSSPSPASEPVGASETLTWHPACGCLGAHFPGCASDATTGGK
jgi:hypothetical protein